MNKKNLVYVKQKSYPSAGQDVTWPAISITFVATIVVLFANWAELQFEAADLRFTFVRTTCSFNN
jgi:hypothetical protein